MEQVKKIQSYIIVKECLITFAYKTRKGYYREQQRTLRALDKEHAKATFEEWSKKVRTMTNVQILGIDEIKNSEKVIAL